MARKKPPSAPAPRAEAPPRSLAWLQGLACGALVAMAPGFAVLGGVLGAPAWVALALDRAPGRPVLRSVALCNAAACVAPVRAFWAGGHGMDAAWAVVGGPIILALAWSAGAAGWALAELCPLAVRLVLEAVTTAQSLRLRARRAAVAKEWALEG
ncbi:MAG: hypothetical protein ACP5NP_05600 [Acetobacteraceae bacterium]